MAMPLLATPILFCSLPPLDTIKLNDARIIHPPKTGGSLSLSTPEADLRAPAELGLCTRKCLIRIIDAPDIL